MIKSVSALLFYVADVDRTLAFYQELGFQQIKSGSDRREVRLNWFRLKFVDRKSASGSEFESEASAESKGTGTYACISVENFDEYRTRLREAGMEVSDPSTSSRGNRQFTLKDRDGYNLAFFEST